MTVLDFIIQYRDIGFGGLLAVVFIMIVTGRLVPRSQVNALLAIWQKSYEISEQARKEQAELMKDSVEAVNTAAGVFRSIRKAGGKQLAGSETKRPVPRKQSPAVSRRLSRQRRLVNPPEPQPTISAQSGQRITSAKM